MTSAIKHIAILFLLAKSCTLSNSLWLTLPTTAAVAVAVLALLSCVLGVRNSCTVSSSLGLTLPEAVDEVEAEKGEAVPAFDMGELITDLG